MILGWFGFSVFYCGWFRAVEFVNVWGIFGGEFQNYMICKCWLVLLIVTELPYVTAPALAFNCPSPDFWKFALFCYLRFVFIWLKHVVAGTVTLWFCRSQNMKAWFQLGTGMDIIIYNENNYNSVYFLFSRFFLAGWFDPYCSITHFSTHLKHMVCFFIPLPQQAAQELSQIRLSSCTFWTCIKLLSSSLHNSKKKPLCQML